MSGWLPLTIANIDLKAEKGFWKAEAEHLRMVVEVLEDELDRVSSERDELRPACEFYANDLSWKLKRVPGYKTEVSDIEMDLGMRAKRALGEGL